MEKIKRKIDEDLASFIAESRDLLEEMEPALIGLGEQLEHNLIPDKETVNLIFRGFHTIKGTAAFYQLDGIVSVAHKSETLLEYFRGGKETINATFTDILCHACDAIEELFHHLETIGYEDQEDDHVRSVIHRLNGRIDVLRKKHDDPDEIREDTKEPMEEPGLPVYDREKSTGRHVPQGKIGQHTRIFVSECRTIMNTVGRIHDDLDGVHRDLENIQDMLHLMHEGALFLGFEHMGLIVNHFRSVLKHLSDEKRAPVPSELEQMKGYYDELMHVLDLIEESGIDMATDDDQHDHEEREEYDSADADSVSMPDGTDSGSDITDGDSSIHALTALFFEETSESVQRLKNHLRHLKHQRSNPHILDDVLHEFHQIKGSAGLANQGDLEWVMEKAEACMEKVLDNRIVLDGWDIKALWHVVSAIKNTVSKNGNDQSRIRFERAALAHIMDQITSGKGYEDKERDIRLPDIDPPVYPLKQDMDNSVQDEDFVEEVPLPLPEPELHINEKIFEKQTDKSTGLLWGGEKRKSERRDIRVSIDKLDELINLVGELVIAENMVVKNPDVQDLGLINFEKAGVHLRKIVRDLQDVVLAVRMVPISGVFRKMIRLVHDLSLKSGKRISLKLIGEDTEIDKTVAELISDPLVHLVRNAVDHGIEKKSGTPAGGTDGQIVLEARHEGGEVLVIVRDNGKGLDMEKILAKAKRAGILPDDAESLSDNQVQNLIFHPGFSTQDTVTDVSGRGVGMDVVKKNMEKVKGRINVYSKPQKGTTFVLRIPLTLAIIEGMLVKVGEASYTIPLLTIRETVQVTREQITMTMDGQEMVNLRGNLVPIIRVHDIYNLEPKTTDLCNGLIVVVEHHFEMAGLFIDSIIGEQQTVIKAMSGYMKEIHGISGCTILGDGEVSLILDVAGLIQLANQHEGSVCDWRPGIETMNTTRV